MNTKIIAILLGLLVLGACSPKSVPPEGNTGQDLETTNELKKFGTVAEIQEFLTRAQGLDTGSSVNKIQMLSRSSVDSAMAPTAMMAESAGGSDYSGTNVQVQGVDEADFVKNDGKYIYTISGNQLVIVDAYPGDDSEIVSETKIEGNPSQLFLNRNRLVVFSQDYDDVIAVSPYDFVPRKQSTQITKAIVFDVSNRKKPIELYNFDIRGRYFQSRMIGDHVYFVVNENAWYSGYVDTPIVRANGRTILTPEVY